MLNIVTRLARCYEIQGKYKDAEQTLETALGIIGCIFKDDDVVPPIHHREQGDIYMMLAGLYLKDGDEDGALRYLKKMADYDLNKCGKIDDNNTDTKSPLLNSIPHGLYNKRADRYRNLKAKLTDARFDALRSDERYVRLLDAVTE